MTVRAWLTVALIAVAAAAHAGTGTVKGTVSRAGTPPTPLPDAVVMVEGPGGPPASGHAVMDQRHQQFVPRVLAVPVGTTVDFPNSDQVLHNVFSASPAKRFDLGMYPQGESRSTTFDSPGVVHVQCNVHSRMEGFVVVHTNPYAAVTDAHGGYTIPNVPAGSYQVRVWHEDAAEQRLPVTVQDGEVLPLDVQLQRGH